MGGVVVWLAIETPRQASTPALIASNVSGSRMRDLRDSIQAETSARGELFAVARLDDPDMARVVHPRSTPHAITDGPFIETKEWLVGFYLLECESEEQALTRARTICPDNSHVIEVRPVSWRWGP